MNQLVNRRNLVSGSAAVAVSLSAVPAFAEAKKFQRSKVDELEAAFNTAHDKLIAMGPGHSAAERRYMDESDKLVKPERQQRSREEQDEYQAALMKMTFAELRDRGHPLNSKVAERERELEREYAAALQAYNDAKKAIREKLFDKIDRAYDRQVDRVSKAASAALNQPAETLEDVAAKVRVYRAWNADFEDHSAGGILDDISRFAGKAGSLRH